MRTGLNEIQITGLIAQFFLKNCLKIIQITKALDISQGYVAETLESKSSYKETDTKPHYIIRKL